YTGGHTSLASYPMLWTVSQLGIAKKVGFLLSKSRPYLGVQGCHQHSTPRSYHQLRWEAFITHFEPHRQRFRRCIASGPGRASSAVQLQNTATSLTNTVPQCPPTAGDLRK